MVQRLLGFQTALLDPLRRAFTADLGGMCRQKIAGRKSRREGSAKRVAGVDFSFGCERRFLNPFSMPIRSMSMPRSIEVLETHLSFHTLTSLKFCLRGGVLDGAKPCEQDPARELRWDEPRGFGDQLGPDAHLVLLKQRLRW